MHILLTGSKGTLGQALTRHLEQQGHQVSGWNRHQADPLLPEQHAAYIDALRPDAIMHLAIAAQSTGAVDEGWRVNVQWSEHLAQLAQARGLTLIFTSTALVFNNDVSGPFTVDSSPNASEGYGLEKRQAEERVHAACPSARIVRLGWQIGDAPFGNNMLAWAAQQQRDYGVIGASTRWYPACSFLPDTARALEHLLHRDGGLYLADSNREDNFYDILMALRERHGFAWTLQPNEDYVYDQRLLDARLPLPPLEERLPELVAQRRR